MRIFTYKTFHRWAKSEKIDNSLLRNSVNEIEKGLFDANLGSNLYKKRIAKFGRGKSSGYRTILAFKHHNRTIFMYGFSKNERSNISEKEELVFKKLTRYYLEIPNYQLDLLVKNGELFEVTYEDCKKN